MAYNIITCAGDHKSVGDLRCLDRADKWMGFRFKSSLFGQLP